MKSMWVSVIISLVAGLFLLAHFFVPNVEIDAIAIALLILVIAPWLAPILKSVELPGGVKIEFKELKKVEKSAAEAGLLKMPSEKKEELAYLSVAQQDPNLALAGLRIEIERRLRAIARACGLNAERWSIGQLLRHLRISEAISQEESAILNDLVGLLSEAVHGAKVDPRIAEWAIDVGPSLLAALDERLPSQQGE